MTNAFPTALPGQWHSVVPAPTSASSVEQLWHRELIEIVERARHYVGLRRSA